MIIFIWTISLLGKETLKVEQKQSFFMTADTSGVRREVCILSLP